MAYEYKPHGAYDTPFNPERCKASVYDRNNSRPGSHQCSRKPWRDGWCKQHHPDSVAKRRARADERYEQKRQRSPMAQLRRANEEIARLKVALENLRLCVQNAAMGELVGNPSDEFTAILAHINNMLSGGEAL